MRRGRRPAWLLVKKADKFADGDPVKTRPESVKSGKTIDQLGNEYVSLRRSNSVKRGPFCPD